MFKESYNTIAETKTVENTKGRPKSNAAKGRLKTAKGAHEKMKEVLTFALHGLMTAFINFNAAIVSITLQSASEGQVTTVINDFKTQIRELTDEVSKTSNMQIEKVEQHEAEMRSLLNKLSDELKLDANDRLEEHFIKKQEELLRKMQTYIIPGNLLIEPTFDLTLIKKTLPPLSSSSQPPSQPSSQPPSQPSSQPPSQPSSQLPPQSADGRYVMKGDQLSESVFEFYQRNMPTGESFVCRYAKRVKQLSDCFQQTGPILVFRLNYSGKFKSSNEELPPTFHESDWKEDDGKGVSGWSVPNRRIDSAIRRAARVEEDERRRVREVTDGGKPRSTPFRSFFSYGKLMSAKAQAVQLSNRSAILLTTTKMLLGELQDDSFAFSMSRDEELQKLRGYDLSRVLPENDNNRCTPKNMPCNRAAKYRTFDGWCNNLKHPEFGNTFNELKRLLPPAYEDGIDEPRSFSSSDNLLPNPRVISNVVHHDRNIQHSMGRIYSHMLMQLGQLIDHDLTHSPFDDSLLANCSSCDSFRTVSANCVPIPIPFDDPHFLPGTCLSFVRSIPGQRQLGARNQLNQISSFLDASPIYGSTDCEAEVLREMEGGRLLTARLQWNGRDTLPQRDETDECRSAPQFPCFQAGDDRNSQHPALVSLQSILLREHNRIADELSSINRHWGDEQIYQETRRIVSAQWAHIVYSEYLPKILGREVVKKEELLPLQSGHFEGYDSECDATISQPFATAAFRFGHSTIGRYFPRLDPHFRPVASDVDIADNFDNTTVIYDSEGSVDSIVLGLVSTRQMALDRHVTDGVRNHLFSVPGVPRSGLDLISINIMRGRDHGIGSYNVYREYCGLPKALSFFSLKGVMRDETIERLQAVYESADDIDLYTGIVSELPLEEQLQEIRQTSLAALICANSAATQLHRDVLSLPHHFLNKLEDCRQIPSINLGAWKEKGEWFQKS
ncbi:hypothetical protein WR25_17929 isoform B [Diploscapter pachys]|nr:hypothetical protein WR25_17929 isoform B [Diploscapter pachys]